jgi:hypothetical protein
MTDGTGHDNGAELLRRALNFTDADLVENRAGRMSADQLARMTRGQAQTRLANLVMLGVFVVLVVVIAIIVLPPSFAPQPAHSSQVPPWIIGLVILFFAAVILISFARTRRRSRGLTGALRSVEGDANPTARSFGDANQLGTDTMFRVHIGGVTFPVSGPAQVDAFEKGRRYRAYYVTSTLPVLLSAEALDS